MRPFYNKKTIQLFFMLLLTGIFVFVSVDISYAGMPNFTLTDIAQFRFKVISFFILTYLGASAGIWILWNGLQKDFRKLPKLTFPKAMLLVFLWGLAFHLILVVIAGTRELMTPQVWEKSEVVHKIAPDTLQQNLEIRRYQLEKLKAEIWKFTDENEGQFPSKEELLEQSPDILSDPTGKLTYNYIEPSNLDEDSSLEIIAYEPNIYGQERMALLTNGNIELLSLKIIQERTSQKNEGQKKEENSK